ncbi:MAG: NusG domain II-containing protein [Bacilli bacterium]|nr:NusG domain II-containing protein [Bacilli bacterium]
MKKADIVVIVLVFLLSVGFYVIYFTNNANFGNINSYVVEVYYDNKIVYSVDLKEDTNEMVKITTENKLLYLSIDKDGDEVYEIINEPFAIENNHEIINEIVIEFGHIHMHDANCKNKLCMNMRIGNNPLVQIVCTNDVKVKLVSDDKAVPWIPVG